MSHLCRNQVVGFLEKCSKLRIKTGERIVWVSLTILCCSVIIVNFEYFSPLSLVSLLLTLNK